MNKLKLLKKKEPDSPPKEDNGEWWKDGYVAPPPPKKPLFKRIRARTPFQSKPHITLLGLKQLVALVLVIFYGATFFSTILEKPELLALLLPTVWILLDYIKRTRKSQ